MKLPRPAAIAAGLAVTATVVAAFGLADRGRTSAPIEAPAAVRAVPVSWTPPEIEQRGRQRPAIQGGLEGGVDWLNVAGPIHLEDLRGKIVLLDFWTYCCINCHHILPDLKALEAKYPNELVVIGVHTAKFDAEKDTDNIRKKVAEYRIEHPVINDANQVLWNRFGVSSWPTLVLIDAQGRYFGAVAGEGKTDQVDKAIARLIAEAKTQDILDTTPLHFPAEVDKPHKGALLYPGKVLADFDGRRLFITDTGHNRIVVTNLDGKFLEAIGDGSAGSKDGSFAEAQFNRPQGTCLDGATLYVADVENHEIRACDLGSRTVSTVAGTGEQASFRAQGGRATRSPLNSPWDLVKLPGTESLLIAMAGPHQIWKLDLKAGSVSVWAGTGTEDVQDGPAARSAFAQPSGLATDGTALYVADSEGSAVRAVALEGDRAVVTIAGTHDFPQGQSLFAFGDQDGRGGQARFQHCLGVALDGRTLYVADTYNNKIKSIALDTREVETVAGTRQAGGLDKPPQFDEPGGVSVAAGKLYIADTNNHAIRTLDLASRAVATLALDGVTSPKPPPRKPKFPNPTEIAVPNQNVAPVQEFTLDVTVKFPEGFKVNPDAPMPVLLEAPDAPDLLGPSASPTGSKVNPPSDQFLVPVPLARAPEAGETVKLTLSASVFECKVGAAGLCRIKNYVWTIPVTFADGGVKSVTLSTDMAAGE